MCSLLVTRNLVFSPNLWGPCTVHLLDSLSGTWLMNEHACHVNIMCPFSIVDIFFSLLFKIIVLHYFPCMITQFLLLVSHKVCGDPILLITNAVAYSYVNIKTSKVQEDRHLILVLTSLQVSVPKGSLCNLNVKLKVGLPPDAIYNIVIDPDNRRVFKNIKVRRSILFLFK